MFRMLYISFAVAASDSHRSMLLLLFMVVLVARLDSHAATEISASAFVGVPQLVSLFVQQ